MPISLLICEEIDFMAILWSDLILWRDGSISPFGHLEMVRFRGFFCWSRIFLLMVADFLVNADFSFDGRGFFC